MGILDSKFFPSIDGGEGDTPPVDGRPPRGTSNDPVTVRVAPSAAKYSTAKPEDYRYARSTFANEFNVNVSDLTYRVNSLAQLWFDEHGMWPRGSELYQWDTARNSIWTYASGGSMFEPYFGIANDDGSVSNFYNDPIRGWTPAGPGPGEPDWEFVKTGVRADTPDKVYGADQVADILRSFSPASTGRVGSRGGGGGAGRSDLTFDRAKLREDATNRWRGLLLEEPDEDTLDSLVNGYISEANAFWMKEAGSLDYDTYVVDRVRSTDRHTFLYDKKPEFQSEAEYMGGFRQTVGQFGMNDRATLRETESGAHSGAGLAGFGERVGRTSEVRAASAGSYSQRFAQSMASSGLGRT